MQEGKGKIGIPPSMMIYVIGIPLTLGLVYFGLVRPVMRKFKLIETPEDKALKKLNDDVKRQPFWSASWYKTFGGNTLTDYDAGVFAQKLIDAMGSTSWAINPYSWGTNETKINGVFSALGSKGNIVVNFFNALSSGVSINLNLRITGRTKPK